MSGTTVNEHDLAALLGKANETVPAANYQVIKVPATFRVEGKDADFLVEDLDAWAYTEVGIFASGKWEGSDEEKDLLIPYRKLDEIEFHFDRLNKGETNEDPGA